MIIFFGDSITRDWPLRAVVPDGPVANAGVAGETSRQMRSRFARDALGPQPDVLHLLAGINDLAENQGPVEPGAVAANIGAMVGAARAQGIAVVVGLVLPCTRVSKRPQLRPQAAIAALNDRLRDMFGTTAIVLADYHTPLLGADGGLRADCTGDGLHPNATGYAVMHPIAREALGRAARWGER